MSKQSKARDKAFQAAAAHMRTRDMYETSEDYGWNLIWDAARTWTVRNWRAKAVELETHLIAARHKAQMVALDLGSLEASVAARDTEIANLRTNLNSVLETSKFRLAKIKAVETTAEDLEKKILVQAGIIERQRAGTRTLTDENNRLRDRLTAARDDARVFSAQLTDATDELEKTKAQLELTRKHTTSATWKVFEENERLVAELNRLASLLADAEETIRSWEGIKKAVPRPPLAPCTATMSAHRCQAQTRRGDQHADRHQCHCGVWWSGDGRGYHEPTHPVVPGR